MTLYIFSIVVVFEVSALVGFLYDLSVRISKYSCKFPMPQDKSQRTIRFAPVCLSVCLSVYLLSDFRIV